MKTFLMYISIVIGTGIVIFTAGYEVFVAAALIILIFGLIILEEKATEILDKLKEIKALSDQEWEVTATIVDE